MNLHYWKISVWLSCVLASALGPALPIVLSDEPLRLAHRWEIEPDIGVEWLQAPTIAAAALHPERFASEQLQVVLDESQLAIRLANSEQLEGREAALQAVLQRLQSSTDNRQVHLALAGAAIALADASHADALWERLNPHVATRPLIERALAQWKSPQALELWRQRLRDQTASLHDLHLAAVGVAASGGEQDMPALESLLRSDRLPVASKILVARGLGQLMDHDLEPLADAVLATQIIHRELLAAELLSRHSSPRASQTLQLVLKSDHQPARTAAYITICRGYPELARELAEPLLNQTDNNLRAKAVDVLDQYDDPQSLRLQAQRIADHNFKIRTTVRGNLQRKAQIANLKPVVVEIIDQQLSSGDYRGIEQAIQLSVALGETRWCPAYLELLEYPRPETSLIAAWALQELADTPELMQGILAHTLPITERLLSGQQNESPAQLQQAFLFEALGRNRYQPALETLKPYIPKRHNMGDVCRASAIWAIGKIQQDTGDPELAAAIAERMLDESNTDPEDSLVQYTATVALGWIKAPGSLEQVKRPRSRPRDSLTKAAEWATEQLN